MAPLALIVARQVRWAPLVFAPESRSFRPLPAPVTAYDPSSDVPGMPRTNVPESERPDWVSAAAAATVCLPVICPA